MKRRLLPIIWLAFAALASQQPEAVAAEIADIVTGNA